MIISTQLLNQFIMDFIAIFYSLILFFIVMLVLTGIVNSCIRSSESEKVYQHKPKRSSVVSNTDLMSETHTPDNTNECHYENDCIDSDDEFDEDTNEYEVDEEEVEFDNNIDYDSYLSAQNRMHGISLSYFNECKSMCNRITIFLEDLNSNIDLTTFIETNVGGIDVFDNYPEYKNYNKRLFSLFSMDITNCMIQMGHDFKQPTRENLALMLWIAEIIQDKVTIDYSNFELFWNRIAKDTTKILSAYPKIRDVNMSPHDFYIYKLLNAFEDFKTAESYMSLLYRFCSLVAYADGKLSYKEQTFIKGFDIDLNLIKSAGNACLPLSESKQLTPTATGNKKSIKHDSDPYIALEQLIGLGRVKEEVNRLANFIKIQKLRADEGLSTPSLSYHCIFTGNPGTGKTTVARILAGIYKDLGVIKGDRLVETDRSGLVAEYVGQTAIKTNKIIDSALDGILFIDEAYTLSKGSNNDFGAEAIATLLKRMEDDRDRLVVIIAGYEDEMEKFLLSNPGLKSRFSRTIHFDDYTQNELYSIFESYISNHDYALTSDAKSKLSELIHRDVSKKDKNFGNARYIRNLFEHTLENQANRLSKSASLSVNELRTINAADLC